MSALRHRLAGEEGFTLVEILVVLGIMGTLLGIAVPSYVGFETYAVQTSAQSALRDGASAAETYYTENGTYVGMTRAALTWINADLRDEVNVASADDAGFCLDATVKGQDWSVSGPGEQLQWYANLDCSGTPIIVDGG